MLSSARCDAAGVVGRGEVLGRERPEVVPVVADRDVRAEEAELRLQRADGRRSGRAATPFVAGAVTSRSSASSVCCSGSSSCVERRVDGRADDERAVEVRQRARAARPRRASRSVRERRGVREERPLGAQRARAGVERARGLGDRVLQRLRVARDRPEGVGHRREQARVRLRRPARRRARRRRARGRSPGCRSSGRRGCARPGVRRLEQLGQPRDRLVEVGAAAGEGVAEATRLSPAALARRRVEHLGAPGRARPGCASGARAASRRRRASAARARGRARRTSGRAPSAGGSVTCESTGTAPNLRSSFSVQLRADLAAGQRAPGCISRRRRRGSRRADLVAGDEVRAVGEVDLELRRRHERQAGVRVVGEEDGDDDHEHGHGADEHRARDDGGAVAAAVLMA